MIYLDNASTTMVKEEVNLEMIPWLTTKYFNPSSPYSVAHEVADAVADARKRIAETINVSPEKIYFTSCGSESDNWAIKGAVLGSPFRKPHIITTNIEHHAVLNTCKQLEDLGLAEVTYVPVDEYGFVFARDIAKYIKDTTILVSVMSVNNEIGITEPIEEIADLCCKENILFHTDAVQGYGKMKFNPVAEHIDMMSVSGHKIGAPKGIGFLYIKEGFEELINSLISGGQQEFGLRAGTENVPYIIGLAKACEIAYRDLEENDSKVYKLMSRLMKGLTKYNININGPACNHIANLDFYKYRIRAEELVAFMDEVGICIGSGSACNSHSNEPSHVLKAIGLSDDEANCCVRISLNENNTEKEIDFFLQAVDLAIETMSRQ